MISAPVGLHSPYIAEPHSKSDASYIEKKTVSDIYKQMKEQSPCSSGRSLSSAANLTSLCVDISPSSSNFFEVLYVGKIKVWQNIVPDAFIDDALEKFRMYELEKTRLKQIGRLQSDDDVLRRSSQASCNTKAASPPLLSQRSISCHSNITQNATVVPTTIVEDENGNNQNKNMKNEETDKGNSSSVQAHDLKSSVNTDNQNRTMVLQVDRTDLRLISPDRKVILLHKHYKDVTSCLQGLIKSEYFGFICKETSNETDIFTGFIFKCESASIASDAVAAISQAFLTSEHRPSINSCEHCPIVWFNKLNAEVEHMSDKRTQAVILKRLEQLDPDEQMTILTKFRGADTDCIREQNEFLLMLLRAHCESKQIRHIHDTAENRSEFLNQYLGVGGVNVFSKAKKSISNSLDQFLKRRSSLTSPKDRQMSLPVTQSLSKEPSPSPSLQAVINETCSNSDKESEGFRSESSTTDSTENIHLAVEKSKHSSISPDRTSVSDKGLMMDIFLKVGSPPVKTTYVGDNDHLKIDNTGSWRQAILKKVITPKKEEQMEPIRRKKSKDELRELWKKAIRQAVLLIRMERENQRLKAEQVESAVKRVKLEYDEMRPNQREVMEVWEMISNKESHIKCDKLMLLQAIRQGVPRAKRGDVWYFLAEQHCLKSAPPDPAKYPNYNVPYEELLRRLTSHQHAILIDLGRTFPHHSYFSSPLGPGQLALFNLLKAYSLLDPEVGYCQGLSFIAGILLLHMEESRAFSLLRHLMFRRGMRTQYLPDMVGLQIKLYQLSRLVHDQLPDLYDHLEVCEVAPTLYAAPWILTMFASQFPLGFVARVFDLVFLEGLDVVFRVALALLTYHKDNILLCDGFEEIMDYFKGQISNIDKPTLDKLMKMIYTTDFTKQLDEYKVEYQVLQEEMASVQPQIEILHKLEEDNKMLTERNKSLTAQLELSLANVQRLEKTRVLQQARLNKLEMQSRGLDVTIATLGGFINNLIEDKVDVEIPDEVRRILSKISLSERNENLDKGQNNLLKMLQEKDNRMMPPERVMLKSLSTGKINLPTNLEAMTRANSLNTSKENILRPRLKEQTSISPSGSTEKKSHFFSSSHNNILEKQRLQNSCQSINSIIDIEIEDFENKNERSESIGAIDLQQGAILTGGTIETVPTVPENHPLSNCGVNFSFEGTKELKHFKSLKHQQRNSSPDVLGK
ncbi:hypothetical protein ABEB36_007022 [Hypothenemus hampei]|uniref:Rab-GAP TBC domain-containing protein n=1 Tax=Hypothenemus hampei TaxID=57062 RepID=A0ABD1ESK9_HYPHA